MCNIGKVDKIIRLVLGAVIIFWGVMNNSWFGAIGLIPLGTALMGWCPLYSIFGINTGCQIK
ncbi:MAG: DUF2892 domain-containing protein [Campylobacterales bacterium]|nr:DUF2892 domain-containing protein [Campylobacterales bacterium]